ncbi:MAG: FkbM family methyltransferase, partial [Alphaproteobacteria bacterium]|nr:FkbM family methyltransferase [Alphaproteobacteria bacterium]
DLQSGFAQANTLVAELHHGEETRRVRTVSVDALVAEHGLSRLDMLSLTLNGAEIEALEGADETLAGLRPRVRLAGWYERGGRRIADIAREILERHGYRVFVGPHGNLMAL